MKKTLLAFAMALCSIGAFAATQYEFSYGEIGHILNDYTKTNSPLTAWADRAHRLSGDGKLQNTMYFMKSAEVFISFSGTAPASFGGYYVVNGNQKGAELSFKELSPGVYTAVDAAGNPVMFNTGDALGFWVEDVNGKKVYNTPGLVGDSSYNSHTFNGTYIVEDKTNYAQGFGNYGQYIHSLSYESMFDSAAFNMNIKVGNVTMSNTPGPVGQPLPGIIASLLVGGGALGVFKFRKSAKKA